MSSAHILTLNHPASAAEPAAGSGQPPPAIPKYAKVGQVLDCDYKDFCAWLDAHLQPEDRKPVTVLPPLLSTLVEQILGYVEPLLVLHLRFTCNAYTAACG